MRTLSRSSGTVTTTYQNPNSKRIVGGRSGVMLGERTAFAREHILRSLAAKPMTSREIEQLMPLESSCDLYFHLVNMAAEGIIIFEWDRRNGHRARVYSLPPTT